MSNIPSKVKEFLDQHNLIPLEFAPGTTPTVKAAAEKIGVPEGQIAKSILFKGKDDCFRLVVAAGDVKIKSGMLKRLTGVKHSMTNAEETKAATGFLPGGVCPFGLQDTAVEILIDESLFEYALVYPAAGTDGTGVPVAPGILEEVTQGTKVAVTEKT